MRIIQYIPNSVVDGIGVRQVFYTSGCSHHCFNCHNPQTWDYDNGNEMSVSEIVSMATRSSYNVTFSGGDPFYQAKELKAVCELLAPIKNIWVYTGYTWEELIKCNQFSSVLPYIDVIVDGRYVDEIRDTTLRFRGSRNQRIIDVKASLQKGEVVIWDD